MKILNCGYYEAHENNIWRCIFDVEDGERTLMETIDQKHISDPETLLIGKEEMTRIEGKINEVLSPFELEVLYNEADNKVFNPADLVYIDFNGDALLFDYELDLCQQEYILECIKKEI